MAKDKVVLKWSKKERDWEAKYPEMSNRNGRITSNAFLTMIQCFEDMKKKDYLGNRTDFVSLREYLLQGGFDPDTFTISVKKLEQTKPQTT